MSLATCKHWPKISRSVVGLINQEGLCLAEKGKDYLWLRCVKTTRRHKGDVKFLSEAKLLWLLGLVCVSDVGFVEEASACCSFFPPP